jgi:hypothetical protein
MNEGEKYVDRVLDSIIERARKVEESRASILRSPNIRSLYHFDKGDRVSMILSSVAINGIHLEQPQRVEGILVHPEMAIVDVKLTDGLEEWEGKTIGLGVCTDAYIVGSLRAYAKYISGNGQVAYYLPEDMGTDRRGVPTIKDSDLHHLPLKYTKVTVGGSVIVDFT